MTWDKDGKPSAWSEPAYWSMGLLNKEDWTAQWIGSPDSVTAPYYRQSFNLEEVPDRAPYYIAALGYFELYINGKKVGKEVLAPAVSNFSKRTYYKTYDVARYLKEGKNNIGIWMGTGWYNPGYPGVVHNSPVVQAQLEIPSQIIKTDASLEYWRNSSLSNKAIFQGGIDEEGKLHIDLVSGVGNFKNKVLFMAGECNTLIGEGYQKGHMNYFNNADMVVIKNAGHTMFGEQPIESIDAVRRYFNED